MHTRNISESLRIRAPGSRGLLGAIQRRYMELKDDLTLRVPKRYGLTPRLRIPVSRAVYADARAVLQQPEGWRRVGWS